MSCRRRSGSASALLRSSPVSRYRDWQVMAACLLLGAGQALAGAQSDRAAFHDPNRAAAMLLIDQVLLGHEMHAERRERVRSATPRMHGSPGAGGTLGRRSGTRVSGHAPIETGSPVWRENGQSVASVAADDGEAPLVEGVSYSEPVIDGVFGLDEEIYIDVHFSEPLAVTGAPRLAIEMGTQTRYAKFNGWDEDRTLWFGYVVQADDRDADGISVAEDAIDLDGATVRDLGGNDAVLDLGEHARTNDASLQVDGSLDRAPVVTGLWLNSRPIDDTYALGESIRGEVAFNESVSVTGMPGLGILIGEQVGLADIRGDGLQRTLEFEYVVSGRGH